MFQKPRIQCICGVEAKTDIMSQLELKVLMSRTSAHDLTNEILLNKGVVITWVLI